MFARMSRWPGSFRTLGRLVALVLVLESILVRGRTSLMKNRYPRTERSSSSRPESRSASERYLVYPTPAPPGSPTKVQLIMGLGLPMEVDVSMIVGYVMKFNYALPYNASYLTQALPYDSGRDRSIDRDRPLPQRKKNDDDDVQEQLRESREAVSPTRWEIYRAIESALEGFQVSGKGCLLRTVCHAAEVAFDNPRSGLLAELVHLLLTPSTTREKYEAIDDQEYRSAEAAGRDNPGKCLSIFPECHHNLLEYFTETNTIVDDTKKRTFYPH